MHRLCAKDLMTRNPITIDIDENMLSASRLMLEKNIRHLLVTNNGELVGMLSDRDVNRAIKSQKTSSGTMDLSLSDKTKVREFMNWPVYTVSESSSAKHVLEQILIQKVSAFAVEDESRKITGVITVDDFLGHLLVLLQRESESNFIR